MDASPKTGASQAAPHEKNLRGIGVSVCVKPVHVPRLLLSGREFDPAGMLTVSAEDEETGLPNWTSRIPPRAWWRYKRRPSMTR
jgi:hypothetical protein